MVDGAAGLVLRIDADKHHPFEPVFRQTALQQRLRVDDGAVEQAAQGEVVGQAAVEQVDKGAFAAVGIGFDLAQVFFACFVLQPAFAVLGL